MMMVRGGGGGGVGTTHHCVHIPAKREITRTNVYYTQSAKTN